MAHILVVEDDAAIQLLLELALVGEGYDVRVADNGQQALEIIKTYMVDLLVVDMSMPIMDGVTFITKYRQLAVNVVPIILLTAQDDLTLDKAFLRTVDDFIAKPFDLNAFLECVEKHLTGRN